jgi:hypothetical protein
MSAFKEKALAAASLARELSELCASFRRPGLAAAAALQSAVFMTDSCCNTSLMASGAAAPPAFDSSALDSQYFAAFGLTCFKT